VYEFSTLRRFFLSFQWKLIASDNYLDLFVALFHVSPFLSFCGVNFINILRAAFMLADPKSAKRQSSHQCLLPLLGALRVKAEHKMLVKSALDCFSLQKIPARKLFTGPV